MTDVLLSVRDLKTWFSQGENTARAVDGVSFDIRKGETFALMGESGCGKSMTSLSIMQLVPQPAGRIVEGSVRLGDEELLALSEAQMRHIRGKRIAMIFQEPMTSLNPVLTVGQQIGESLLLHKNLKGEAARTRTVELLRAVGIPAPETRVDEYPHQLSGGMKQRVMIAIALAAEPDLLIADEPTTALDVTIQAQVLGLLKALQQETGMAIMLITHDLGVVSQVADRVAVMYAGQIVEQAHRDQFFANPQHPYSEKLLNSLPSIDKRNQSLDIIHGTVPPLYQAFAGCRFANRCDYRQSVCDTRSPTMIDTGLNHKTRCHRSDPALSENWLETAFNQGAVSSKVQSDATSENASRQKAPLLDVKNLKVHYPIRKGLFKRIAGHVFAVDGIGLSIPEGRTLALVGESGCGKTTVAKAIIQLIDPTSGEVVFDGDELTQLSAEAMNRRRSDIQFIFQDPFSSMNPRMMVGDIIEEGMVARNIGGDRAQRQKKIGDLLQQVGLSPDMKNRYPHEFSGGQRQRICIARALAVEPKLIICDEPTSALDVSVQAQILNLLKGLQDEFGLSYLFITHNISVVSYLADEIAVMYLGRIVEQGSVETILQNPQHPYTKALLSAVPTVADGEDAAANREVIKLQGDMPSPIAPPPGCHFHPRCPIATDACKASYPEARTLPDQRVISCHEV
ncbi:MAG: ABC transporter ATP-binding protein [bacterium]